LNYNQSWMRVKVCYKHEPYMLKISLLCALIQSRECRNCRHCPLANGNWKKHEKLTTYQALFTLLAKGKVYKPRFANL